MSSLLTHWVSSIFKISLLNNGDGPSHGANWQIISPPVVLSGQAVLQVRNCCFMQDVPNQRSRHSQGKLYLLAMITINDFSHLPLSGQFIIGDIS